jgi:excisionase family DNA binding protein
MSDERYYSADDVARLFCVDPAIVFNWARQRKMPFKKMPGGKFLFPGDEVRALWENRYTTGFVERRRFLRFETRIPVDVVECEISGANYKAETIDLSPTGLKLRILDPATLSREVPRGTMSRFIVSGFDTPLFRTKLPGSLRRYELREDGSLTMGLEFDIPMQDDSPSYLELYQAANRRSSLSFERSLTAQEAADFLDIELPDIFEYVKKGRLAFRKTPGGAFKVPFDKVMVLLEKRRAGEFVERCKALRITARFPIRLTIPDSVDVHYNATTTNISSNGLRLEIPTPSYLKYRLLRGDLFDVILSGLHGPLFREYLHGSLRWYEILDDGNLMVGVQLHDTAGPEATGG